MNALGQGHLTGTTGQTNVDVTAKTGGMKDYNAMVRGELQRRRDMLKPIQNRYTKYKQFDKRILEEGAEQLQQHIAQMEEENHYQKPAALGKEDLARLQNLFAGDEKFQSKKQIELQK